MKILTFVFIIWCLLAPVMCYAGIDDGLIAHWKFDEVSGTVAADALGKYPMKIVNSLGNAFGAGQEGNALSLDGFKTYAALNQVQSALFFTGQPMTLTLWLKPSRLDMDGGTFLSQPSNGWTGTYYYHFFLQSDRTVHACFSSWGNAETCAATTTVLQQDVFSHIAVMIDAQNRIKIFINGVLSANEVFDHVGVNHALDGKAPIPSLFIVGCNYPYGTTWAGRTDYCVQGVVDDVRVYSKVLSIQEVIALSGNAALMADKTAPVITILNPTDDPVPAWMTYYSLSLKTDEPVFSCRASDQAGQVFDAMPLSFHAWPLPLHQAITLKTDQGTSRNPEIRCMDLAGNESSVMVKYARAMDSSAPLISYIQTPYLSSNEAVIAWTSSEPSDTGLAYGLTTAYGSQADPEESLSYTHFVHLKDLRPGTTYHVKLSSKDQSGNVAVSDDVTLTTVALKARFLYVSFDGNDANPGTETKPFASLERARDEIRQWKLQGPLPKGGVTVYLKSGTYYLGSPFILSSVDSGRADAPVLYAAMPGATVRLTAAKNISGFQVVNDPAVLARLSPEAREHVLVCDLPSQGVSDFGVMNPYGDGVTSTKFPLNVFFNDQAMTLARYPNTDWDHVRVLAIDSVTQGPPSIIKTKIPHGLSTGDKAEIRGRIHGEAVFVYTVTVLDALTLQLDKPLHEDDFVGGKVHPAGKLFFDGTRPALWQDARDIWTYGFYMWDWAASRRKIQNLAVANQSFVVKDWTDPVRGGQRYYFENILEELDAPGEWYLDRDSGRLFFWPPSPVDQAVVSVSASTADYLVSLNQASYIGFQGIAFEKGRWKGVNISRGNNNVVENCEFGSMSENALGIYNSAGTMIRGNRFHDMGGEGVNAYVGDMLTLSPGYNIFMDNDFYKCSEINTSSFALNVTGVGHWLIRNYLHDLNGGAIIYATLNSVIEYNEIEDIQKFIGDGGGIYTWWLWYHRGNVIRYNYLHDIQPTAGHLSAMYLDGFTSGDRVYGNLFYHVQNAIHVVGRDNITENNLIVKGAPAGSLYEWGNVYPWNLYNPPMIVNATHEAPVVITMDREHLFQTGDRVEVYAITQRPALNGVWTVTVLSPFQLRLEGAPAGNENVYGGAVAGRDWVTMSRDQYKSLKPDQGVYKQFYPMLAETYRQEPLRGKGNAFLRNVVLGGPWIDISSWILSEYLDIHDNTVAADTALLGTIPPAPRPTDFIIPQGADIWKTGFKPLPLEKMSWRKTGAFISSGDVSGDGRVTMYDAALVLKYTVGGPLTSAQQAQADINSDTTVDASDAQAIAKRALGL